MRRHKRLRASCVSAEFLQPLWHYPYTLQAVVASSGLCCSAVETGQPQYTAMAVCYLRPTTPPVARYYLYWAAAVQFFPRGG